MRKKIIDFSFFFKKINKLQEHIGNDVGTEPSAQRISTFKRNSEGEPRASTNENFFVFVEKNFTSKIFYFFFFFKICFVLTGFEGAPTDSTLSIGFVDTVVSVLRAAPRRRCMEKSERP